MFPNAHSVKLLIVYGLSMSKTATFDTFTIQLFTCTYIAHMVSGYSQGGAASFQGGEWGGGVGPPPPPPNETLIPVKR